MFYKLLFDMSELLSSDKSGFYFIFASESNLNKINEESFSYIIYKKKGMAIESWPNVEFYYDSRESNKESEYLLNSLRWPIVHKKVQNKFEDFNIVGIQYLPIRLIDKATEKENNNYVLMNILNSIEAFDMKKSSYLHTEKHGEYYSFIDSYLDAEECSKYDIFRTNKDIGSIYVSEWLKAIIEDNDWKGFYFNLQKTNIIR